MMFAAATVSFDQARCSSSNKQKDLTRLAVQPSAALLVIEDLCMQSPSRALHYCTILLRPLKCACLQGSECVSPHLEERPDIFSPSRPKASLNLLFHLAAKAELTVAAGPLLPDALPAALLPPKWRVIMSGYTVSLYKACAAACNQYTGNRRCTTCTLKYVHLVCRNEE